MKQGRIKNITYVNGMPVHPYRVGDIVTIEYSGYVPIGAHGSYTQMKEYDVRRKGDHYSQGVTEHDLEEI